MAIGGFIHALLQTPMSQEGYDVLGGYMSPVGDAYSKPELAPARHRCAHKSQTPNYPDHMRAVWPSTEAATGRLEWALSGTVS